MEIEHNNVSKVMDYLNNLNETPEPCVEPSAVEGDKIKEIIDPKEEDEKNLVKKSVELAEEFEKLRLAEGGDAVFDHGENGVAENGADPPILDEKSENDLKIRKTKNENKKMSNSKNFVRETKSATTIRGNNRMKIPTNPPVESKSGPITRSKSAKIGGTKTGGIQLNRAAMLRQKQCDEKRKSMPASSQSLTSFSLHSSVSSTTSEKKKGKITSKIGSLNNIDHKPGGGKVRIQSKRQSFIGVKSRCGTFDKVTHKPGGGDIKIENKRTSYAGTSSRIGSFGNVTHKPGGGDVKIQTEKLKINPKSKIGTFDNVSHKPGGGNVKIQNQKIKLEVKSKIGSLDNTSHTPKGGKVKIFSQKHTPDAKSKIGSFSNSSHTPGGGKVKVVTKKIDVSNVKSRCGTMDNVYHKPSGGDVKIKTEKVDVSKVAAKCGSLNNITHKAGGGKNKIYSRRSDWSGIKSKCGTMENVHHQPGGGDIEILTQKIELGNVTSKCGTFDNISHAAGGGDIQIFHENLPWKEGDNLENYPQSFGTETLDSGSVELPELSPDDLAENGNCRPQITSVKVTNGSH